ncbi:MAG: purine-cytosine permease family protein [Actinomycetota bacterium]
MATVTERLDKVISREAPVWGVRPTPDQVRRLSGLDFAVLWGDLALGLLVLVAGGLLIPSLSFPQALLAIVLGSAIGCVPLALVGRAGAREGVPGMVLLRHALGIRGSYVPSALNILQLLGWTAFELWAMALVASRITGPILGVSSFYIWLAVAALVCVALSLGGPVLVVRRWMERFGVWVLGAAALWITVRVLTTVDLSAIWSQQGDNSFLTFGGGVDLVIALPVSWIPLVADYNRFARRGVSSAAGTFVGYLLGNVWFYALGALLVLAGGAPIFPSPGDIGGAIVTLGGGTLVLVVLLVGETDEAFADIYSSAVSAQNLAPRLKQRGAIVAVSAVAVGVAAWLFGLPSNGYLTYESFLLLIGSVFVPLFAVFLADYHLANRGSYGEVRLFGDTTRFRPAAFVAWVLGFLVFHAFSPVGPEGWTSWVASVFRSVGLEHPLAGGNVPASLVAFAVSFGAAALMLRRSGERG